MRPSLATEGYEIHRQVIGEAEVLALRDEADRVGRSAGTVCVRNLRARSERFDSLAEAPTLRSLLPPGLSPVRSILFDKTPTMNWPVSWHQDLTIAVSDARSVLGYGPRSLKDGAPHVQPPVGLLEHMVTIRLHLDDTSAANGALRVIPGSHLTGKISSDAVAEQIDKAAVTCECRSGDVILMSPLILHSSQRSQFPGRRRVIHFEYARKGDLHPSLEWFERERAALP